MITGVYLAGHNCSHSVLCLWCSRLCPERGISGGLMAAVGLGVAAAEAVMARAGERAARCVIACDNSPASVTLAGEPIR